MYCIGIFPAFLQEQIHAERAFMRRHGYRPKRMNPNGRDGGGGGGSGDGSGGGGGGGDMVVVEVAAEGRKLSSCEHRAGYTSVDRLACNKRIDIDTESPAWPGLALAHATSFATCYLQLHRDATCYSNCLCGCLLMHVMMYLRCIVVCLLARARALLD
jgi:hypothetical protein